MSPRVTVGIPVYNDLQFIHKCLDSLLNQTYQNIEIVISDDHSFDGSQEVCEMYAARYSNIIYHRQAKNIGISLNMQFLLQNCESDYFMWAANDDEWSPNFIELLIEPLISNIDAAVAFGPYIFISESGEILSDCIIEDFSGKSAKERLRKFILKPKDGFGYGLFRTSIIKGVRFPIWVWPNDKCAYNNIYPTLFYYLNMGQYCFVKNDEPIWFNRIKTDKNVNHKIPFKNSGFTLCFIAYLMRKLNVVFFSIYLLIKTNKNIFVVLSIIPRLFYSWFIIPVFLNIDMKYKAYSQKRFEVFI